MAQLTGNLPLLALFILSELSTEWAVPSQPGEGRSSLCREVVGANLQMDPETMFMGYPDFP